MFIHLVYPYSLTRWLRNRRSHCMKVYLKSFVSTRHIIINQKSFAIR